MLYGEYTSAGALVREYVYLNGQLLAQVDAGTPEVLTYIHTDHLGTPRFGTNTGGTQVWTWTSDAFGVGAPSGSRTVNLRMAGQYYDSESGLFYNWNRYYNPAIGRYISSDPIGLNGGLNTFSYVEASPVMYTDPEGLDQPPPGWEDTYYNDPDHKLPKDDKIGLGMACFASCVNELFSNVDAASVTTEATSIVGATPISKEILGEKIVGKASKYTNAISYIELLLKRKGINIPHLPSRQFDTTRVCGAVGRANVFIAEALLASELTALEVCMAGCQAQGGF